MQLTNLYEAFQIEFSVDFVKKVIKFCLPLK